MLWSHSPDKPSGGFKESLVIEAYQYMFLQQSQSKITPFLHQLKEKLLLSFSLLCVLTPIFLCGNHLSVACMYEGMVVFVRCLIFYLFYPVPLL